MQGMADMEYRRRKQSNVWHWCRNCSNWPTGKAGVDYVSWRAKPEDDELDGECLAKSERGVCQVKERRKSDRRRWDRPRPGQDRRCGLRDR